MTIWRKQAVRSVRTPRAFKFNTDRKIRRICKRCGKGFTPTTEDQEYGVLCRRKMAGQTMLMDRYVVPPRKRRHKKASAEVIECRDEKGEITAVIV